MIPKIIHYCWFSGEKKPKMIQKCIDSWSKVMPNYNIKCWDGNSLDFNSVKFVRDAMAAKKYAFAADYVRLYALYTEGGIYLDSDVLTKRPFDIFLNNAFFCGTEAYYANNNLNYRMEAAIMGAEKGDKFIKKCLDYYSAKEFTLERTENDIVMPAIISNLAEEYGYQYKNTEQHINNLTIYPTSFFTNTLHPDTYSSDGIYAIHQNAGSWIDYSNRGRLFRFCKKNNLMNLYRFIESFNKNGND